MQSPPGTIGRYQILAELGQGAMGVVYLAMDPTLKRKVAIKCMKEKGGQKTAMERFRREAETSSRLNHPNIITVYDVGEDEQTGPFMAMEFVEGSSLAALIEKGSLNREEGFQILTQIMYGLMAAAAGDIVHRDVKPENLLVGKDGRVKLMDFGIARGDGDRLTTTGMVVGTPSYTAPELLLGKDASFATDLYAFVVTAFELITGGALPYSGDSLGVTLYRIVHEAPAMPEDLEPELAAIFNKGLQKDPSQRYPDLGSFMSQLAGALNLPAPVMPSHGAMPGHGAPSGVSHSRPSQDEMRTSAVPARKTPTSTKGQVASGEIGRQLTPPPQSLMQHKSSGEQTPKAHAPSQALPPSISARPAAASKHSDESEWVDRLKLVGALSVLLVLGITGWNFYQNSLEHSITVKTNPPYAHVWVDGKDLGSTPTTVHVKQKAKTMRLEANDHESMEFPLTEETSTVDKDLQLKPGFFKVITEPKEAKVYLDGVQIDVTPIYSRPFKEHPMDLRIEKVGYETWQRQISADKPPPSKIQLKLKN